MTMHPPSFLALLSTLFWDGGLRLYSANASIGQYDAAQLVYSFHAVFSASADHQDDEHIGVLGLEIAQCATSLVCCHVLDVFSVR
jgi:hypothetical protein